MAVGEGKNASTSTPYGRASTAREAARACRRALDAPYMTEKGEGRRPAGLAANTMQPR